MLMTHKMKDYFAFLENSMKRVSAHQALLQAKILGLMLITSPAPPFLTCVFPSLSKGYLYST